MHKFKVGDVVKILSSLDISGRPHRETQCHIGKTTVITDIDGTNLHPYSLEGMSEHWGDSELELVKEESLMNSNNLVSPYSGKNFIRETDIKEGDEFILLKDEDEFSKGTHVWLIKDDGSVNPFYSTKGVDGEQDLCLVLSEIYPVKRLNGGKPMARRTFKQLVETPTVRKGALYQEKCDDGTQEYILLDGIHSKDNLGAANFQHPIFDRSLVEDNSKMFVEVFKVEPEYMTAPELADYKEFLALKNKKTVKKPRKGNK